MLQELIAKHAQYEVLMAYGLHKLAGAMPPALPAKAIQASKALQAAKQIPKMPAVMPGGDWKSQMIAKGTDPRMLLGI